MPFYVEVTTRAQRDVRNATRWYAKHSSNKALDWAIGCDEAIESLAEMPARCPVTPESRESWREVRHLLYEDHRIIFEIEDETVTVLHVRHQKKKPFSMDSI